MRDMYLPLAFACAAALAVGAAPASGIEASPRSAKMFPSAFDPAWSPDGRRIAYVTDADGDYEIAVMNADGSGQRVLTKNRFGDLYPAWTPDSRRLVFLSDRVAEGEDEDEEEGELYSMRLDGTDVRQLTSNEAGESRAVVSPDGTHIVYSTWVDDGAPGLCRLYVMAIDGTGARPLVVDAGDNHAPAWSPDGRRIAFEAGSYDEEEDEYSAAIDVVNADGTGRMRLTDRNATHPAWTADGHIVYSTLQEGEVRIMNADGADVRTIAATRGGEYRPDVSPDGRRLAFDSDADGYTQIYVSLLDGSGARKLTGPAKAYTSTRDRCTIVGTLRADVLTGTAVGDVICGLGGNDRIVGAAGGDIVDGGAGRDRVEGGAGDDRVLGAGGDDTLVGGAGIDQFDGGAGADTLLARDGRRDFVDGGLGRDRATVDAGDWVSLVERIG